MIHRFGVICPGCDAQVVLRVSVGVDDVEPFFYVCGRCGSPTKVVQRLILKPSPHVELDLEGGEQFDPAAAVAGAQVITIHPEWPAIPGAAEMWDKGGSPFLYQFQLVGDNLLPLMQRMATFRGLVDCDWAGFKRFARFYALQDWPRFDDHGKKLLGDAWPTPTSELRRHDVFHQLALAVFRPILVPPIVAACKADLASSLRAGPTPALAAYCRDRARAGVLRQYHQDVMARLDFVARHKSAMLACLPVEFYKSGTEAALGELRLFRDEFDALKAHYIDTYELAHKVLTLIVGVLNCAERGDPDAFDPAVQAQFRQRRMNNVADVRNLGRFERLSNAPKRAFLAPLPEWGKLWDEMLDPGLRNPIGHHSARHDLATGTIVVDGQRPIPYLRFAFETMRLTHLHLLLLHVLKMMWMIPGFRT